MLPVWWCSPRQGFTHNGSNAKKKNKNQKKKKNAFYLLSVLKKEGDVNSYRLGQLLGSLRHALVPALFPSFLYVTGLLLSMGSHRVG